MIVLLLLLINSCCYASTKEFPSLILMRQPCIPINKDSLSSISYIIQNKNKNKERQSQALHLSSIKSIFEHCPTTILYRNLMVKRPLAFKVQQEIYKVMLLITKALQQFPIMNNPFRNNNATTKECLPLEMINHILSYFSMRDIQSIKVKIQPNDSFAELEYTPLVAPANFLNNHYYISHYGLFSLIRKLICYESNNHYYVGWSPFFIELEEHFTPHIRAYLSLINNPNLENEFKPKNYTTNNSNSANELHCKGKLLFLYFSGMEFQYNNFIRYCTQKNIVLSPKQIQHKASQLAEHSLDDHCIWCDLYRK